MMTSLELIEKFTFPISDLSYPTAYIDAVGFGVLQEHGNNRASTYHISFDKESINNEVKKVIVGVNYGEKIDGGIRLGINNNLFNPVDLDFPNEVTYNTQTDKFYLKKKEIKPNDILLKIKKIHNKPTKLILGLPLRSKLWFWRKVLPTIIKWIDFILIGVLCVISGETVKDGIFKRLLQKNDKDLEIKKVEFKESETIDFFGYEAKRWSVVFYSLLHLLLFYFKIFPGSLDSAFNDNLVALCYVVVSFFITESLVPELLKSAIKGLTPKMYGYISFKRLKV